VFSQTYNKLFKKRKPKSTVDKLLDHLKNILNTIIDFIENKKARFGIIKDRLSARASKYKKKIQSSEIYNNNIHHIDNVKGKLTEATDSIKNKTEDYIQRARATEGVVGKVTRKLGIGDDTKNGPVDKLLARLGIRKLKKIKEKEVEPEGFLEETVAKLSGGMGKTVGKLKNKKDEVVEAVVKKSYGAGHATGRAYRKVKDKADKVDEKLGISKKLGLVKGKKDKLKEILAEKISALDEHTAEL
jgi:hypothetical protein